MGSVLYQQNTDRFGLIPTLTALMELTVLEGVMSQAEKGAKY